MENKTPALVLKSVDYKDNDRMITLFTPQGKCVAVLKGCKKASAKLKFAGEPFCFGEYYLNSRGGLSICTGCDCIDLFYDLRNDENKIYTAFTILEALVDIVVEGDNYEELFKLTIECLHNICYTQNREKTTLAYFLLHLFKIGGLELNTSSCVVCGSALENKVSYSQFDGGFACGKCNKGILSVELLHIIDTITHSKSNHNPSVKIKATDIYEIFKIIQAHFCSCFDKKLKTLDTVVKNM